MANLFYAGKMLSMDADSQVTNGINASADIDDGSLVVLGNLAADTTYVASGDIEHDLYEAAAPAAATDEVAIVDYAGISEGEINGNRYKMGVKLFGLKAPKGEPFRVRRLHKHDKFWLGAGNFESTPTVGEFAEAKASSFKHDPKSSHTAGRYGIKILKEEDLTTGMESNGKRYLCEVIEVA